MTSPSAQYKLSPEANKAVSILISNIKLEKIKGSLKIALATLALLEDLISKAENANAFELCLLVRAAGSALARARPHAPAANIARRVLRAIRTETRTSTDHSGDIAGESLQKLVMWTPARRGTIGRDQLDLREPIREHIAELRLELESTFSSISAQALEHIDSDSVVLCGMASPLLEQFLRRACKEHTFRLVVPEGPRANQTHGMAARLSSDGLPTTVITNAAVFAIMSRITKVVIDIEVVVGGGAVLAAPGTLNITAAAQHYNVPVLALTPLYKLTPLSKLLSDPQEIPLDCPAAMHNYEDLKSSSSHVYVPLNDFITPDQITLYITNTGGNSPSYIYRTMSELYDPADNQL